jgi:hypothetical protein
MEERFMTTIMKLISPILLLSEEKNNENKDLEKKTS